MTRKKIVVISLIGIVSTIIICMLCAVGVFVFGKSGDKDQSGKEVRITPTPTSVLTITPSPVLTPTKVVTSITPTKISQPTITPTQNMPEQVDTDFEEETNYRYYSITGSTEEEMRNQLDMLGPKDSTGERFDALAVWNTSWNYQTNTSTKGCSLESIVVEVDVVIDFPKWETPSGVSSELVEKWNEYTKNLKEHEEGHKNNGIVYGQKIADSFKNGLTASDCTKLDQLINDQAMIFIKQAQQADLDYDQETDHGATQGATFP